jgi:hypothetical protein
MPAHRATDGLGQRGTQNIGATGKVAIISASPIRRQGLR